MQLFESLIIETQLTPQISIDLASGSSSGSSSWLMQIVKPRITIQTALGSKTVAPWGEPSTDYWPMIEWGLLTVAALALWRLSR